MKCDAVDVGSTVPQTVTGTTVGRIDTTSPSCGAPGGLDAVYTFSAPTDGIYRFDTVGSTFDTILHVRAGVCVAPELACDDDTMGVQSMVSVRLGAGQTVSVVVDGFGSNAGVYTLNITR